MSLYLSTANALVSLHPKLVTPPDHIIPDSSCILEVYIVLVLSVSKHINIDMSTSHFVKIVAIREVELNLQRFPLILIRMGKIGIFVRNDPHKDIRCLPRKLCY